MGLPSEEELAWATLERLFRDLSWAALDAERAGRNPESLYDAQRKVFEEMRLAHPDLHARHCRRLESTLKRWGDTPEKMMRPKVVNRHHFRGTDGEPDHELLPKPWMYIGRKTSLGNPYTSGEHGAKALTLYKAWLWNRVKLRDEKTLRSLAQISWDTHLVCSCAPRPCHGDVVVAMWLWLQRQAWWSPEQYR